MLIKKQHIINEFDVTSNLSQKKYYEPTPSDGMFNYIILVLGIMH